MMKKAPEEAMGASLGRARSTGFLWAVIACLLLITSVPYGLCYTFPPPQQRFTGVLFVRNDTDSYYAWMNQARHGHWLFENKYQTRPHAGAYFNGLWLVLGNIARLSHLPLDGVLHIARLGAGALLVLAFYALSGFWLRTPFLRALALLLFIFGGGFGWAAALILKARHFPDLMHLDLGNPEQWALFKASMDLWAGFQPFFQVFLVPHFAVAHALFLSGLYFFLRSEKESSTRDALIAGLIFLVTATIRPYEGVTAIAACGLYAGVRLIRRPSLATAAARRYILAVGLPAPAVAYYIWLLKFHPIFKFWGKGGASVEPNGYMLLALGLCGVIGLGQFLRRLSRPPEGGTRPVFLLCWLSALVILIGTYPMVKASAQMGVVIMGPMVLLTVTALQEYFEKRPAVSGAMLARGKHRPLKSFYGVATALVAINSLSAPLLLYQRTTSAQEYYLDERTIAALQWLDRHTQPSEAVLSSEDMGLKIPAYAQNYVFLGHPHLADDYELRSQQLARFFDAGEEDDFRRALLRANRIAYVFYGPYEKELGPFSPSGQPYLRKVYGNETTEIYQVLRDRL